MMFAVLGDIEFELITYWDGFEATFGVDYAEHARIGGKPGLQFVGDRLDEIQITLVFLQTTISAVRVTQKMKDNPVVALTRVPGLMSGLGNISGALGKSVPAFNALSESMPDAISLARTASEAATYVQQAQSALSGVDKRNIAGALDTVSGQLNAVGTAFNRMSPGLSAMAARILTRSV